MLLPSSNNLAIVASDAGCSAYLQVGAIVIYLVELGVNTPPKSIIGIGNHLIIIPNNLVDPLHWLSLCHYHQGQKGNITPGQLSLPLEIEPQYLTPSIFRQQLSLAIDLHQSDRVRASDVGTGVQLCLLK